MLIQYLLVLLVLLIVYRVVIKWRQGILSQRDFIFWAGFWLVVGFIVIIPETTSFLAELVGIGRGADLVVYLSIVLVFYIIFQMTIKMEKIERNVTKIIRAMALSEEKKAPAPGSGEARSETIEKL
jgi:hypothetical protein